jgi:arginase
VRESVTAGRLPIVLAGSCDAAIGVVGGLGDPACGVVWLDAHGDFNTPETTLSGFFAGMSLAIVTGDCYRSYWSEITDSAPVSQASTLLIGARAFDPVERERVVRSAMTTVEWRRGRPERDVDKTVAAFATGVRRVYLHVDLDVLDPSVAPGVVDEPVPGGMSLGDVDELLHGVIRRFQVAALTVATFNPERDQGDRTRDAVIHLIERFVERLAGDQREIA